MVKRETFKNLKFDGKLNNYGKNKEEHFVDCSKMKE